MASQREKELWSEEGVVKWRGAGGGEARTSPGVEVEKGHLGDEASRGLRRRPARERKTSLGSRPFLFCLNGGLGNFYSENTHFRPI